jgi:predicted nucleic acid-binding protein
MILRSWLKEQVLGGFEGRILPIDTAVALLSAQFQVPDPHPVEVGLIAATALVHGMTVVTRNVGDFEGSGVAVLNPWD